MRKTDVTQHSLYSYRSLEERIPDAHPLRKLRVLVDAILVNMNDDFQALYSRRGRPSITPERRLRASLIQQDAGEEKHRGCETLQAKVSKAYAASRYSRRNGTAAGLLQAV